jgi:hypothetical protein
MGRERFDRIRRCAAEDFIVGLFGLRDKQHVTNP